MQIKSTPYKPQIGFGINGKQLTRIENYAKQQGLNLEIANMKSEWGSIGAYLKNKNAEAGKDICFQSNNIMSTLMIFNGKNAEKKARTELAHQIKKGEDLVSADGKTILTAGEIKAIIA